MSNKIIGIKQADGSFFPILNEGDPDSKTLELTTVRDDQTTVKVNLYKQYEDKEELEYVDTLLIQNLVPHKKEEPSYSLSIGVDEDGLLSAEVIDPETGAKSDTTVSLVTLSEAQLNDTSDFGFVTNPSSYDFESSEFTKPELSFDDELASSDDFNIDSLDLDTELLADDEFSLPAEDDETVLADEGLLSDDSELSFDDELASSDDFNIDSLNLDTELLADDEFSLPAEDDETVLADEGLLSDDSELSFDDELASSDDFNIDSLNLDTEPLADDEFSLPAENDEAVEDFNFDLDDDFDDSFKATDVSEELSLTDDFETDFENDSFDESPTVAESDFNIDTNDDEFSFETEDDTVSADFDSDISLNMDDDFTTFQDTDIDTDFDANIDFDNESTSEEDSSIQYAEFGEQKTTNSSGITTPPLFDKKLNEDMAKRQTKSKYPLSTVISILCAIICIIAVIVCFILFAWPSKTNNSDNTVIGVEPPVVFEKEKIKEKEQGIEVIPPKIEENKIEIVEKAEVIPVKPPVPETAISQNIKYRLIWGDTLWDISDTFYRNPWLFPTIADANNIENPDYIIAGTDIDIPIR